jgi:hypothetical protein
MGLFGFGKKRDQKKDPKAFRPRPDQIRNIAKGFGGCIASDRITVDGLKVGYMYRTRPHNPQDSGWSFLSGDESQEYLDNPDNHHLYEVNTIANFDPEIIPFLKEPPGSAFAREGPSGKLVRVESPPQEVAEEEPAIVRLTDEWSFRLEPGFERRKEDGQLVFWAPGRTIWISAWDAKDGESPDQRISWIKKEANPNPIERF